MTIDNDAVEGVLFSGIGTVLAIFNVPTEQMIDAFFIGLAGGVGGLIVKLIQWSIKRYINKKKN